jgi:hypothetical protein
MPTDFTIVVDSAEKVHTGYFLNDAWMEAHPGIEVEQDALLVGDYTLEGHRDDFTVERKTIDDWCASITSGRKRFESEWLRAPQPLLGRYLIIEHPHGLWGLIMGWHRSRVHPRSSVGTLLQWSARHNIIWHVVHDRVEGEEVVFRLMCRWLKAEREKE